MGARATWIAYLLLLALSIPWYFPEGSAEPIVFGMPLWCVISLSCYIAAAALTIWRLDALWSADVVDSGPEEGGL